MDDWSRRTPDSLHRAVDEFVQATRLSPSYAEAYAGLANCYNLLREFTLMPAAQAYPLARAAAKHALALNNHLASAHVALAFVDSYWDWNFRAARREYALAIALDPNSDLNHHWFATFLSARGEYPQSLAEFRKAMALNPTSLAIRADYGLILYGAGYRPQSRAILLAVEAADPKFLSPHRYLANIYQLEGRDADFLRESEIAARLTDDQQRLALLQAAKAGLARDGRRGMLSALLDEQLKQFKYGAVTAYEVADTYAMIGQSDQALAYLQTSIDRREENAINMNVDLAFAPLRAMPRFKALLAKVRPASDAQNS
jgi:Tfp pilus assembly protein PilF